LGFSLGGALALKVAEAYKDSVRKNILIAPALYTEQACPLPFGPLFKKSISVQFSFLDSTSFSVLKNFKGEVLLIIREYDGLSAKYFGRLAGTSVEKIKLRNKASSLSDYYSAIHSEVIPEIEKHVDRNNFHKIILSECDHSIMSWLRDKTDVAKILSNKIAFF
tara:strand:- start:209 stop:700 length:492 start_codon:yes stop_codon:yes gene_type:complete